MSRRRVQSFIASATSATGLTVGCAESSSMPAGPEAIHAGVVPDVRARASVTAEFDIIEVRGSPTRNTPISSCWAAVEAALAGVRLDPHGQIEHLAIGLLAGLEQLTQVPPIHADIMDGAGARMVAALPRLSLRNSTNSCRDISPEAMANSLCLCGHAPPRSRSSRCKAGPEMPSPLARRRADDPGSRCRAHLHKAGDAGRAARHHPVGSPAQEKASQLGCHPPGHAVFSSKSLTSWSISTGSKP